MSQTIIDSVGKYKTRGGEVVTIEVVSSRYYGFQCKGKYSCGIPERWNDRGRVLPFSLSNNDIVEKLGNS